MLLEGRYRLVRQLNAGATAEVWSAHDELLRRQVAVRLLRADRADAASRFLDAGRLGARLSHSNVAAVYDVGVTELPGRGPTPYVVMEYAEGRPLTADVRDGLQDWRETARVGAEMAAALAYAHSQWVAHGTLGPAKVLRTDVGVKVIGFGTDVGVDLDAPTRDVHALGTLLAATAPSGIPVELDELMRRCRFPDPVQRPGSDEAALILARLVQAHVEPPAPLAATTRVLRPVPAGPQAVPPRPAPRRPRQRRNWASRALLVTAVAGASLVTVVALAQAAPGAIPWFDRAPQQAVVPPPTDDPGTGTPTRRPSPAGSPSPTRSTLPPVTTPPTTAPPTTSAPASPSASTSASASTSVSPFVESAPADTPPPSPSTAGAPLTEPSASPSG
ncbi:protein kinase [Dactylosporangium fulvum]|uniref:non-specific serine/threonine protein kinase n=1 Tax=Dactylosporangium fulvum TaxID=53359 RepID=A0ABY5VPG8_9ACTN|nr:protein kinase [Dactylosporangium fulvum]UWP79062.1 protein kinase [Dactylosporangium fulvum]